MKEQPSPDLVVIGNIAFDRVITSTQQRRSLGGGAYNVALAASTTPGMRIGIVSRVGEDFPQQTLVERGIDLQGLQVSSTLPTAEFIIHQDVATNTRRWESRLGVIAQPPNPALFPDSYRHARHVHLATDSATNYLLWIAYLREVLDPGVTISVDVFERSLQSSPNESREAAEKADMVFMNREEADALITTGYIPDRQAVVIKDGARGARLEDKEAGIEVAVLAPVVPVVDTTGAGDILAGKFLGEKLSGQSIEIALERAVTLASQSVMAFGIEHVI